MYILIMLSGSLIMIFPFQRYVIKPDSASKNISSAGEFTLILGYNLW